MPTHRYRIRTSRIPRHRVHEIVANIGKYTSGRLPDIYGIGRAFKLHMIHGMYVRIARSFDIKSWGGTDDLGMRWRPLKKSTIAYRPATRAEYRRAGVRKGSRGILTEDQNRQWKAIFWHFFTKLQFKLGDAKAKARAAKIAWAIMKSRGAKTMLEVFGNRRVPIHKVTLRLRNSLEPGRLGPLSYAAPAEQVVGLRRGGIEIGSKVPYAKWVHKRRKLWSEGRRLGKWMSQASADATAGITAALQAALTR